ncbi:MAG: O-antigen ligase family protein [Eubacteriaceae bacterium]|nr:O-antigen ligase family protein [Eubacteriaceae bacterium]
MKNISLKTIYLFSLTLLAMSIPIHFRVSLYALAFALIMGIAYNIDKKIYFKGILGNKFNILLILFWLIHFISLLYSSDLTYGYNKIFRMISILILPLFLAYDLDEDDRKRIKLAFIGSATAVLFFFLLRAFYLSSTIENGVLTFNFHSNNASYGSLFYYQEFVKPHHPSYFAMYLTLALVFALEFVKLSKFISTKILLSAISFLLILGIILTSSRAGLVTLIIVMPLVGLWLLNRRGKFIALLSSVVILSITIYELSDNPRFKTIINYVNILFDNNTQLKEEYESQVMIRVRMWPVILKDLDTYEVMFGVGIGDTNQRFIEAYKNHNLEYAAVTELNAHNQFLQTLVSSGILGLLLLSTIIGYGFWFAYKNRNMLLFLFLIIISVNFMFESVLERVFGVIYFTFFLLFLTSKSYKESKV